MSPAVATPSSSSLFTGQKVVDMIIADLALFQRADHDSSFKLIELAPGVTKEKVAEKMTGHHID